VLIRVPDMKRFDQKQLLDAYYARDLVPVWLDEIKIVPEFPTPSEEVRANPNLKKLEGEWRTADEAPRKFWLSFEAGTIRLHTTRLGYWATTRVPLAEVGDDFLKCAVLEKSPVTYKKVGDVLSINVARQSDFHGQFQLRRKMEDDPE